MNGSNLLIGAIVAILFYFVVGWLLTVINLVVPNVIIAIIALLIFLGFATNRLQRR